VKKRGVRRREGINKKYGKTSPWTRGLATRRRMNRRRQIEPLIGYKYPTIASGATPIGSAERGPDRTLKKQEKKKITKLQQRNS
jgi:hypothetical protein